LDLDHNGSTDAEVFAYAKDGQMVALTLDHREPLRTASMAWRSAVPRSVSM
jgi:hypothetical protein